MKITAHITAIGPHALDATDLMMILFDESATAALRDVTVIQQFDVPEAQAALTVKPGDHLQIGQTSYEIMRVGVLANANLQTIGHVSLLFTPVPDNPLENALYLAPGTKPAVAVGDALVYVTE